MEKFVDVIRSHISKICDPEIFLLDKLMFLEQDFMKRSSCSDIVQRAFAEHDRECPHFTVEEMQRLLEKLRSPLPAPRRNQEEGADVRAAVARIERIRIVAQAMYIYMGMSQGDKTAFPNGLQKTFEIGRTYLNELEKEYDSMEDTDENGRRILHLEDAWNNVLRYEGGESEGASSLEDMDADPEAKRQKVETSAISHGYLQSSTSYSRAMCHILHRAVLKAKEGSVDSKQDRVVCEARVWKCL
eukprot:CCRYP_004187-RA/>CCRYP_004187-RA protein AED:0.39 eAED:0.39 QI:0/-1/0/1/-1/1/1/0/243